MSKKALLAFMSLDVIFYYNQGFISNRIDAGLVAPLLRILYAYTDYKAHKLLLQAYDDDVVPVDVIKLTDYANLRFYIKK